MAHPFPLQPGDRIDGANQPNGMFRPGSPSPSMDCHPAPMHTSGDSAEQADVTHELNINSYGDGYDPRSAFRVQQVSSSWDPDQDGD